MGSFKEYARREEKICAEIDERRKNVPTIYLYESREENGISIINTDLIRKHRIIAGDGFAYSTDPNITYKDLDRCCTRLARRLLAMGETEYTLCINADLLFSLTQTDHASKLEDRLRAIISKTIAQCLTKRRPTKAQHK